MAEMGRPTVFTKETIQKLEEAFAIGATDLEACFWAGISKSSLYNYQNENPDFLERKEQLKQKPLLVARQTVMKSLQSDHNSAWRMVERKDPELHPKSQIDHTTKGEKIEQTDAIRELTDKLNEMFRGVHTKPSK